MQIRLGHGTHAFLVRIYIEPREIPGAPPRLAAWVQYLRTGEESYVRTAAEIEAFIRESLEDTGEDLSDWWPS